MPIVSDRLAVKTLITQLIAKSPDLSPLQAAENALRSFYGLASSDGIWSGSDAAICLGYRDEMPDEDIFAKIASDLAEDMSLA